MVGAWLRVGCCLTTDLTLDVEVSWYDSTSGRYVSKEVSREAVRRRDIELPFQLSVFSWRRSSDCWTDLFIPAENLTLHQGLYECHARNENYSEAAVIRTVRLVA